MKKIPVRQITTAHKIRTEAGLFSIRSLEDLLKGNDLVHSLHKHDFFFILAIQQGKGIHEIDFTCYDLHDNSMFILRPGQVHRLEIRAGATGFLLEFDMSFYHPEKTITQQRLKKASGKNYCRLGAGNMVKLNSILMDIFAEFSEKKEGYTDAIRAGLDLFFIEYVRNSQTPGVAKDSTTNYTQERFEELSQLLEKNIRTMKTVPQYASLLNLSPYQLNAIAKDSVAKTVGELISDQVILEAKRSLLATSAQVKDIADDLGYDDVSYFIRFFKRHTGFTPEIFRKNFK